MSAQRIDIAYPIYDSIAPALDHLRVVTAIETVEFDLHVADALDLFHEKDTEPTAEDHALADAFEDDAQAVIDEQVTAWKAWTVALAATAIVGCGTWIWAVTA